MSKILTGIQASGKPHLGNLLGAILPAVELSKKAENTSFLFIADLHSMTTVKDAETMISNTKAVAKVWLACGFDHEANYIYRQSRLAGFHTELMWYLSCLTPFPMLANAHSFKDKSDSLSDVNAGLFTYPVLMASDILLYNADFVPVGKDQKQHLEITRDMAATFNRTYGECFVEPKSLINESVMTIPGIDGRKMSKSYGNHIDIFLPEKELYKTIKKIETDSTPLEEPKNPDTCLVFTMYSLLASDEQIAEMRNNYTNGGYGYGHAKKALLEVILDSFSEQRKQYDYFTANEGELEGILQKGEAKAKLIAEENISKARKLIGFA
ncbi:MAG: tryptophan--tRNA ligase [Spirosomaceae bacterium]|nr:tryptophan--tRNA ligase [Spirosomataceae bacterium]